MSYLLTGSAKFIPNLDFQKDAWHTWVELGTSEKAANILRERWDAPKVNSTIIRLAAHLFALYNVEYVREYLRKRGEEFTDELFERVMVERAVRHIYFYRKNPYARLYDFDEWLEANPWAHKYDGLIKRCQSVSKRTYRKKPKLDKGDVSA